jgi:hypothetical protein
MNDQADERNQPAKDNDQGAIRGLTARRVLHDPDGDPKPNREADQHRHQRDRTACRENTRRLGVGELNRRGAGVLREQGGCSEKEWNPGNKSLHGALITGFRQKVSTEFPSFLRRGAYENTNAGSPPHGFEKLWLSALRAASPPKNRTQVNQPAMAT